MMTFWWGLFFGGIVGCIITLIVLMCWAAFKSTESFLYNDIAPDLKEKLRGRR
jgi:hypothetical protein